MPKRTAAMRMESPGNSSTRAPRANAEIPDSSVDFHRCGNNLGTAVVSIAEVSHKRCLGGRFALSVIRRLLWRLGTHTAGTGVWFAANEIPRAHDAFPFDGEDAPLL